jgi:hypothetical protein
MFWSVQDISGHLSRPDFGLIVFRSPSQLKRPRRRCPGLRRRLANCGAKFVACCGFDGEKTETVEVQKCGLCHGDEYRRDNFRGATS